jgi:hypothetical protein
MGHVKSPLSGNKPVPGSATKPSNVLAIRSFLPDKKAPPKPTFQEMQQKREEELRSKQEREEMALKRKDELAKAKAEEKRMEREARQKKALEAR